MKYSFLSLVFVLMVSCQSDRTDNLENFQSASGFDVNVLDFSGRIYEDSVRLSWSFSSANQQVMLRRGSGSFPSDESDGTLMYRGVNDFFVDVSARPKEVNYYQLFIYKNEQGYQPIAQLIVSVDTQIETTILPILNLRHLIKDAEVILEWDVPEDIEISQFEIVRNNISIAKTTRPFWKDLNPPIGSELEYEVFSLNSTDERSKSSLKFMVTVSEPIIEVSEQLLIVAENNQAHITWGVPENNYYLKTVLFRDDVLIFEDLEGAGVFVDRQVSNHNNYKYSISHINTALVFSPLLELEVTIQDTIGPNNVSEFQIDARNNQSNISWVLPQGVDFDYVELFKNDALIYSGNDTLFIDTAVLNGDTVIYRIQSVDTSGNLSAIEQLSVEVIDDIAPNTIANAHIEIYDSQLTVSWDVPEEEYEKIQVYRSDSPLLNYQDGYLLFETFSVAPSLEILDRELVNGQEYFYGIFVIDSSGNVSQGVQLSATPLIEGSIELPINASSIVEFSPYDSMMTYVMDTQIDSKGRVLFLWQDYSLQPVGFKLERRFADGQLDSTFGDMGTVIFQDVSENIYPNKFALIDTGEIIVAGRTYINEDQVLLLAKFSEDGVSVNGFGVTSTHGDINIVADSASKFMTIDHVSAYFNDLSVISYSGNDIYLVGNASLASDDIIFTLKLDANLGELDSSYASGLGMSAINTTPNVFYNLRSAVNDLGQIYVSGVTSATGILVRLNSEGDLDTAFNSGAPVILQTDSQCLQLQEVSNVALDNSNDIYLNINCYDNVNNWSPKQIHKFNVDGTYSSAFGGGSGITTYLSQYSSNITHMLIDKQQQIWVASSVNIQSDYDVTLMKMNSMGVMQDGYPLLFSNYFAPGEYENVGDFLMHPLSDKPIILGTKYENGSDHLFMMKVITKSIDYLEPSMN